MNLFAQNRYEPSAQAKAVRVYMDMFEGVKGTYDEHFHRYEPVDIAEWHNGRERGYVVSLWHDTRKRLNIAFYEHRNSDRICAVEWIQNGINPLTIESAKFGDIYKDKYDVSKSVAVGQAMEMADWIMGRLEAHWKDAP